MGLKRYQLVGLLAGFPLFSGAWLSAFCGSALPGAVGLLMTVAALFVAVRVEPRGERKQHVIYGASAGLFAGFVARLLGAVVGWTTYGDQLVQFASTNDVFRVVLAGDWVASLVLMAGLAVLGALVALAEPDAKQTRTKTVVRTVKAKTVKPKSKSKSKARRK